MNTNELDQAETEVFWFNGVGFSHYVTWWNVVSVQKPEDIEADRVGLGDVYAISCRIDHSGVVESADPDVFVYAAQEVLCQALERQETVIAGFEERVGNEGKAAFDLLVEGLVRVRKLTIDHNCAVWTPGNSDESRLAVLERIHRSRLLVEQPGFESLPHVASRRRDASWLIGNQLKRLHRLAQSSRFDKQLRAQLHEMK